MAQGVSDDIVGAFAVDNLRGELFNEHTPAEETLGVDIAGN